MSLAIASIRRDAPFQDGNRSDTIPTTDGELLMQFARHRDEHAFAQLIERHGPLVWLICRQALRHHQDVEDAFQATFLILAQRARAIRASDSAASWLYKVALRTALSARRKRYRRCEQQLEAEPPVGEEALPMIYDREMMYVLLDELRALPEQYQTPLVLRYLEGQSRRAIADQTDSTVAQVQGRLVRGRRMLRSRLVRRGVSLSLAAGAITTVTQSAAAALTPSLIAGTATSCLAFTTSSAASGTSSAALELAKEGTKAMAFASVVKSATLIGTLLLAGGIAFAAQQAGNGAGGAPVKPVDLNAAPAASTVADVERPVAFVAERNNGTQESGGGDEQRREKLERRISALRDELAEQTVNRAELAAELELEQMEKALLQRQLEQLHALLLQLKSTRQAFSGQSESKDGQQAREELVAQVLNELVDVKKDFRKQTVRAAELSAELERHERERGAVQRRLEDLERLLVQQELEEARTQFGNPQQQQSARHSATGATSVEAQPAESQASPTIPILAAHDQIRITVPNSLPDQPIGGTYSVEPMGTVALGPSYGRVKVAGLNIFEAEEAIKRHLADIIESPVVQVTMQEKSQTPPTAAMPGLAPQPPSQFGPAPLNAEHFQQAIASELEKVHRALAQLQAENAELRKQLEQNARQSPPTPIK